MYSYGYQSGGSYGVRNVFVGSRFQRGSGIGSFLGGLFRSALPYLGRGLRAVGREVLSGGINVLHDLDDNNANLKESVKNRYRETRDNLKRKAKEKVVSMMTGSGRRHSRLAAGNLYGPLITRTPGSDFQSHNVRAIESIVGPAYSKKKKRRRRKKKTVRKSSSRKKSGKRKQKKTKKRKKKQKRRRRSGAGSGKKSLDIFD